MREVCFFTSTRAEYGLLRRLMSEVQASSTLRLQLIATGTHLSPEFGLTIKEIESDGFTPDECIEMITSSDSPTGICKSMGLAMIGYGEALERLMPEILVLLGDRYETFCCAAAAQVCRIPIAHIHGGETTEGAFDEAFRHSITKMSYIHFTSCEAYRNRVIQLGEAPDRVHNVGALGMDNIREIQLLSKEELAQSISFRLDSPYFLITFHPVTLDDAPVAEQFQCLLDAIIQFRNHNFIITKANADTDGRVINSMIDEFAKANPERCLSIDSLGVLRYLSAMKYCDAVIGNSSSGILETPAMRIPTVNIGDRQKGRVRSKSIIDCIPKSDEIAKAISKSLEPTFRSSLNAESHPCDQPGTVKKILGIFNSSKIDSLKKQFYDYRKDQHIHE